MMLLNPYALATGGGGAASARYWRFVSITVGGGTFLEVSEVQLLTGSTVVSSGKTYTSSVAPDSGGSLSTLFDGLLNNRIYWTTANAQDPAFFLRVDLGSAMTVDGVKQAGFDTANRYMSAFTLQYSDDDAIWTSLGSKSGLTYPGNNTLSSTYSFP